MNAFNKQQIEIILSRYDAEHDTDPGLAPVPWSVERLASSILEMYEEIEKLKKEVDALKGWEDA